MSKNKRSVSKIPTLILLVGNIGSGKSTLCKKLQKNYIILSRDALRYMIGAGTYKFMVETEPIVREMNIACLETLMRLQKNIVLDETNMSRKIRKPYIALAKRYNYKCIAYVFKRIPKVMCVERRMKNPHDQPDRKIWETVWKMFDNMYEHPSLKEGFDRVRLIDNE